MLGKFNFIILDEVLELSLDDSGINSVMELLKQKALAIGTVFVISHNVSVKDKFDNIMRIEIKDGRSYLK